MTYKAKSLVYLGVFASLAFTYHLIETADNETATYVKTTDAIEKVENNNTKTVGLELEEDK